MEVLKSIFASDSGMSDRDRIMLSPIEKWTKHNRFPWKLLVHTLLITLVALQAYVVVSQFTSYYRANNLLFQHFFLEDADEETGLKLFFTIKDVLDTIEETVTNYYDIDTQSLGVFGLDTDEDGNPDPVTLLMYLHPDDSWAYDPNRVLPPVKFNLTEDNPYGPFSDYVDANGTKDVELKQLFVKIAKLELVMGFDNLAPTDLVGSAPFRWYVTMSLINVGGVMEGSIYVRRYALDSSVLKTLGWVPSLVLIVATVSLILGIKAIVASFRIYMRTKKRWKAIPKSRLQESYRKLEYTGVEVYEWSDIPLTVKFDFFGTWYGFELFGEVFTIVAILNGLIQDASGMPISDWSRICLGIGTIFICINMMKYFEYWKKFYLLVLTLQGSLKRNFRFVISVFPLFTGFAICGVVVFGPYSSRFNTIGQTAVSLFALLNGDDVHATFDDLEAQYPYTLFAQLYLFTFVIFFITAILNIFIFIIEDSYHAAKDFINAEAERHSRQHKSSAPKDQPEFLAKQEFDLPTLFDVLEEAENSLPQERLNRLKDRALRRNISLATAIGIPGSAAGLGGDAIVGSLGAAAAGSLLMGSLRNALNVSAQDIVPLDVDDDAYNSGSETSHGIATPRKPRRVSSPSQAASPVDGVSDPALSALIARHQKEFMENVESRIKAAQSEFLRKLTADIQQYIADKS